jgi:pimeloyl-ACP methyl ester carboxylesterase
LRRNVSLEDELSQGLEVLKSCLLPLNVKSKVNSRDPFQMQHYGSHHSREDMFALMSGLEYTQWNLYGVSYGTRLALRILQDERSANIEKIILDSPYPLTKGSLMEWPVLQDEAFERMFSVYPSLEDKFFRVLAQLKKRPLSFSVRSWYGEAPMKVVLNDHRFLAMAYSSLYDQYTSRKIPLAVDAVLEGRRPEVLALLEPFINYAFDPEFNPLVYFTIECRESPSFDLQDYEKVVDDYPRLSAYTKVLARFDLCAHIPSLEPLPGILQNPEIEQPLMILAGAEDPITPARWASALAEQYPAAEFRVFEGVGHSVVGTSGEAHALLGDFLIAPASAAASD